jgi:hypothetical protein
METRPVDYMIASERTKPGPASVSLPLSRIPRRAAPVPAGVFHAARVEGDDALCGRHATGLHFWPGMQFRVPPIGRPDVCGRCWTAAESE